jgi:hypothetical protein
MAESRICSKCGAAVPEEAPFCPVCAMRHAVDAQTVDELALPTVAQESPTGPTEKTGDCIGPYQLLEQIGEGGCGVVYMARQEAPLRRRVALKVLKLGMDTK